MQPRKQKRALRQMRQRLFFQPRHHRFFDCLGRGGFDFDKQMSQRQLDTCAGMADIDHQCQRLAHEQNHRAGLPILRDDFSLRPLPEFFGDPTGVLVDHAFDGRERRGQ